MDFTDCQAVNRPVDGGKQSPSKLQDTIASVASEFDYQFKDYTQRLAQSKQAASIVTIAGINNLINYFTGAEQSA